MMLTRFIEQRPSVSAFVAGALLALCFAPFHVVPLLFVIIPLFFSLLYHAPSAGVAIRHAFLFGYGFFIAGTYWIAFSLLVDASMHGWLVPFSVLGLSAALALYFVPLGWLIYRMRHKPLWFVALMFMVSWVGLEWLRGQGVLGFPWNLVGYTVAPSVNVSQLAAYVGIHGVSVFVLLVSLLPWCVWKSVKHPILRFGGVEAAMLLVVIAYVVGDLRVPEEVSYSDTTIRIVQPNIAQKDKWTPEGKLQAYQRLRALSTTGELVPDIVVWPETAIPAVMYSETNWQHLLDKFVPNGAMLLSGILREGAHGELYNSVVAVADGAAPQYYDKHQLVPFGEFIPFADWVSFMPITRMASPFARGEGASLLLLANGQSVSSMICYEAVFPEHAAPKGEAPSWLLNVTNDAWFGNSPGPYQHFSMVRFRAIERALPVIRAANTGVSAVIDPYGRVIKSLPLNHEGVINVRVPIITTAKH